MASTDMRAFDPTNPADVIADHIRRQVADIGIKTLQEPAFLALATEAQIQTITSGVMVGLMGVIFSFAEDDSRAHDALCAFVADHIPHARILALAILRDGGSLQ